MKVFATRWQEGHWQDPLPTELDSPDSLVLAFGASDFLERPEPLAEVARAFPRAARLGCSTAGEILGAEVDDESVSLAVCAFDATRVRAASAPIELPESSYRVARELALGLRAPDLRAVLVFCDGLRVNGTQLIRGVVEAVGPDVVVSGGLAGDGTAFARTWVLLDGAPRPGHLSIAALYGERIQVGTGSVGGWAPFGPRRRITRARGNVLHELDGVPALRLYKQYLGARAAELPSSALLFPISLTSERMGRRGVVRTVLSVDEREESMTFAGDMPEGSIAQLMHTVFDRLVEGASAAAGLTTGALLPDAPCLSLAISCVGRRLVLGPRVEDETEAVLGLLPRSTAQVGFYSYGEIGAGELGGCDLHNQTMTVTTLQELGE